MRAIAVSPADNALIYTASVTGSGQRLWLYRSRDRGATWERIEETGVASLCAWGIPLLQSHPTDAARVLRVAACYAGRNTFDNLYQSRDQGASWAPMTSFATNNAFAQRLVGGAGADPARLYLAAPRDARAGGGYLFRSDDDGTSWAPILAFPPAYSNGRLVAPNTVVSAPADDPARPERIWAGITVQQPSPDGTPNLPSAGGVRASADGGATWSELGRQDLPPIHDLLLVWDSASGATTLFAATDVGVYRLDQP